LLSAANALVLAPNVHQILNAQLALVQIISINQPVCQFAQPSIMLVGLPASPVNQAVKHAILPLVLLVPKPTSTFLDSA